MFESAELGHAIDKATYEKELPKLREALLDAQYDLLQSKRFPVLIIVSGVEGAGKGETVNVLNEWLDPRHVQTSAFSLESDEERVRPPMWRYWRALPPKGKIGIFYGSWYTRPIVRRVFGEIDDAELEGHTNDIRHLERMLTDEGVLLLKFWFHLSKEGQRERFRELLKSKRTRWRVTEQDLEFAKRYDKFRRVSEATLRETSTGEAPWLVIEGADARYRSLSVGKVLLSAMRERLDAKEPKVRDVRTVMPTAPRIDKRSVLEKIDLGQKTPKKEYERRLEKLQGKLARQVRSPKFRKRGLIAVFEGCDAAGKGGAIRRLTQALDARVYRIVPVAAPTEEERAQPYLWRFWRHVPEKGRVVIFDRSWYGRVLVERVEGFATVPEWSRAYSEINDFEEQLVESGLVVVKMWLQISQEEQLRRFKEREKTGFKRFKITEEDWRNREKWDAYQAAASDMIDRTSTELAPWSMISAEDKYTARLQVLGALTDALERQL
jgi:polyphosphate:AMP phosphotransferase